MFAFIRAARKAKKDKGRPKNEKELDKAKKKKNKGSHHEIPTHARSTVSFHAEDRVMALTQVLYFQCSKAMSASLSPQAHAANAGGSSSSEEASCQHGLSQWMFACIGRAATSCTFFLDRR